MSDAKSQWADLFLENALYGSFFVLYSISSLLLFQRRNILQNQTRQGYGGYTGASNSGERGRLRTMRFWEVTGGIMFVTITMRWILGWVLYVGEPSDMPARMIQFSRFILSIVTILTGDIIMIHRLWVLGNRNKLLVAFPLLALTCVFAFSIPLLWQYYLLYARKFTPTLLLGNWILGVIISTLSVNVYCTVAMSWKIWVVSNVTRQLPGGGSLLHVVVILVESAGIYSVWMIIILGLVINLNPLYLTFYDVSNEIYGISTMFISVRVGLGWAVGERSVAIGASTMSTRLSTWNSEKVSTPATPVKTSSV